MNEHYSWKNMSSIDEAILSMEKHVKKDVPICCIDTDPEELTNIFYKTHGCFIVKGMYNKNTMDIFNEWVKHMLDIVKHDLNFVHPIQSDKRLINDMLDRLSSTDISLFKQIFDNNDLYHFSDILLGFSYFGSATTHYLNPNGKRQQIHVDYPLHLHSSPFWSGDISKMKKMMTRYQVENVLPQHSLQILIAPHDMSIKNGSTEIIPGSHLINDIDIHVHNPKLKSELEHLFVNSTLEAGDVLFFNRRVVHRGGENISNSPRNALILQCVNMWSVPQEEYDYEKVVDNVSGKISDTLLQRLKQPYPKNIKVET
jgi:hypothetical protein